MEVIPDEIFKMRPFPLQKQKKQQMLYFTADCAASHIACNEENVCRKPALHAWKDYFAHLETK